MKQFLLLSFLFYSFFSVFGQCPSSGAFNSQAEIDQFAIDYPDCTELNNGLDISGADIVDLTPFSNLISVEGLIVRNTENLSSLEGLEGLEVIDGTGNFFSIANNSALSNLDVLTSLQTLNTSSFDISHNDSLTNLDGLQNASIVIVSSDIFNISHNPLLVNLNGLIGLETASVSDFNIISNDSLESFLGLGNATFSAFSVNIFINNSLTSTQGLTLGGPVEMLFVDNNDQLETITGFQNITGEIVEFNISNNIVLQNIDEFTNASLSTDATVSINNNSQLASCNILFLCEFLAEGYDDGLVFIGNNAPGCNTPEEVQEVCDDCPLEEVVFNSQADVDAFVAQYPDCTKVYGLTIEGADISDITGLSNLQEIIGDLRVENNPILESLSGLHNIESVRNTNSQNGFAVIVNNLGLNSLLGLNGLQEAYDLTIDGNPMLNSLEGLNSLQLVQSNFWIANNASLNTIDNLESLNTVGTLLIENNDNLTTLNGLINVSYSELSVLDNASLESLEGLGGSNTLSGFIDISGNSSLESLTGLENITNTIGIFIVENANLTSLDGLQITNMSGIDILNNPSLENINGLVQLVCGTEESGEIFITIDNNLALTSVEGLNNIDVSCVSELTLSNNNELSVCTNDFICSYIADETNTYTISNNALGCNTVEEVDQACRPCDFPVILTSQEEVNNFPIIYADCNVALVNGLTISGDDISDLTPLSSITTIQGGLTITNNTILESLEGLGSLSEVDTFEIVQNNQLVNFDGLADNIITNSLIVDGNASLQDFIGFPSLDGVLTSLTINNNTQLNTLTGLEVLSILSDLTISNNESLVNLQGLQNLEIIEIAFSINNNENLQNLTGLENLTSNEIGEIVVLEIFQNNSLVDITGLNNFNNNAIISLYIFENPLLSICSNIAVCNFLNNNMDGDIIIENNAVGCNTSEEVLDSCGFELNKISGTIGYDFNNDGCDESDYDTGNVLVTTSNGDVTFSSITDANGYFELFVDEGTYVSEVVEASLLNGFTVTPNSITSDFVGLGNEEEIQFCIIGDGETNDVSVSLIPLQLPRPGEDASYIVQFENKGAQIMSGDITFEYDDAIMFYTGSEIPPDTNEDGVLVWNYDNLLPFESRTFVTSFELFIPPDVMGGEELNSSLVITPFDDDVVPSDNTLGLKEIVVNSYDPNDKQVLQGEEIFEEQVGDYLDYILRFQNTGTADALNVVVTDTLSNNLNWSTLRILSASHEYRVEISNENEVAFIFEDINLPPEEVDEEGSNGYIAFEIRTNDNLVLGDSVENTGNIFFDFNPPIITNTVVTTVVEPLSTEEFLDKDIVMYPNPVSHWLTIQLGEGIPNAQISLLSLQGQILDTNISTSLDMSQFSTGIYFLKVETDNGVVVKKVIKK